MQKRRQLEDEDEHVEKEIGKDEDEDEEKRVKEIACTKNNSCMVNLN